MEQDQDKNLKLYYSIKEVASMFDVSESTLRYWESEFPSLKPRCYGPTKLRKYQEKDIEEVRLIHSLVKVRGFKIAAARKILTRNKKGADMKAMVLERLVNIRTELQAIRKQLDYLQ